MDLDRLREIVTALPHVAETVQWGDNLVFWVGDKAVGGKMFCVANLEAAQKCVASFAAGAEGFAEMCEREAIMPAPYFARIHWVCVERWDALTAAEWRQGLERAHSLTLDKMSQRTREAISYGAASARPAGKPRAAKKAKARRAAVKK